MHQYILLLHENPASYAGLSPAEMGAIIERYGAWAQSLAERGLLAGGEKLADDGGRRLHRRGDTVLASDGPYAEAKDLIGGYFVIRAESDSAAETLARECPHLGHEGNWIELRRIDPTA
jgi:hypothetical protein